MGFDAIWISPVVENTHNGYHGYWAKNWEAISPQFGGEEALRSLVRAAHEKDIYVMVDVVANHVGPVGEDYSSITPFNKSQDYHKKCKITNWDDQGQVEYCRLANLPDLNTENSYVAGYLLDWIHNLVADYGFLIE